MVSCRNDQNPLTIMADLSGLKIPLSRAKLAGQLSVGDPVLELEASKIKSKGVLGGFLNLPHKNGSQYLNPGCTSWGPISQHLPSTRAVSRWHKKVHFFFLCVDTPSFSWFPNFKGIEPPSLRLHATNLFGMMKSVKPLTNSVGRSGLAAFRVKG